MKQKIKPTNFFVKTGAGLARGLSGEVRTNCLKEIGMHRGVRLRFLREMLGMSIENFAKVMELNVGAVGRLERGATAFSVSNGCWIKAKLLELGIDVKMEWLLHGKKSGPKKIEENKQDAQSFFGQFLGKDVDLDTLTDNDKAVLELKVFQWAHKDSIISNARDNHMEPFVSKGDYVGGVLINPLDAHEQNCIIVLNTGAHLIRRIFKIDDNTLLLSSYDSSLTPQIVQIKDITKLALVLWIRKNMLPKDMEISVL